MRLRDFEDVHPDWDAVRSLDPVETRTVLELLVTLVLIDGRVTPGERATFLDEFARLPIGDTAIDAESVTHLVETTEKRIARFRNNPDEFPPYLERVCSALEGERKQIATMRLLCMVAMSDDATRSELDLLRAIGERFGMDDDTIENLMRSTWESREEFLAENVPGIDRDVKPVRSARQYEERSIEQPYDLPLTTNQQTAT